MKSLSTSFGILLTLAVAFNAAPALANSAKLQMERDAETGCTAPKVNMDASMTEDPFQAMLTVQENDSWYEHQQFKNEYLKQGFEAAQQNDFDIAIAYAKKAITFAKEHNPESLHYSKLLLKGALGAQDSLKYMLSVKHPQAGQGSFVCFQQVMSAYDTLATDRD
jgi:hypothetical protein